MDLQINPSSWNNRDWQTDTDVNTNRFAVIGLGGYAQDYILPAIDKSDFCSISTLVSSDRKKAESFKNKYEANSAITYEEYHAGSASDDYDAIYVATPPAHHLEFVESANEFGKPILCEKPIEVNPKRARQLVDVCDNTNNKLMIAYRLQTNPIMRKIRNIIQEKIIGRVTQIHGEFSYPILNEAGNQIPWRVDPDLAGGGALMDIGIYPLNMSRFFLDRDPIAVQSFISDTLENRESVDMDVAYQLIFPDKITASCTTSFNSHRGSRIQILGTKGRIHINSAFGINKEREIKIENDGTHIEMTPPFVNEIVEQVDYFAYMVNKNGEIRPDGEEGLTDMNLIQSIYKSANRNKTIEISD